MKELIKEHTEIQVYGNRIKEMVDTAIRDKKTVEQLKLDIQSMCIKCLKNAEEIKDCEICNGHTSIQLEINFK